MSIVCLCSIANHVWFDQFLHAFNILVLFLSFYSSFVLCFSFLSHSKRTKQQVISDCIYRINGKLWLPYTHIYKYTIDIFSSGKILRKIEHKSTMAHEIMYNRKMLHILQFYFISVLYIHIDVFYFYWFVFCLFANAFIDSLCHSQCEIVFVQFVEWGFMVDATLRIPWIEIFKA